MDNGVLLDRVQRDADQQGIMPPSGQKLSDNEIQILTYHFYLNLPSSYQYDINTHQHLLKTIFYFVCPSLVVLYTLKFAPPAGKDVTFIVNV